MIRRLHDYYFVINQISLKEHKKRVSETNLGFLWNVLSPLLYMLLMSNYYCNIVTHDIANYPIFIFTGVNMVGFYRTATVGAMRSLVENKKLIIRTKWRLELFVYQKVFSAFKDLLYASIALMPLFYYYKIKITLRCFIIFPVLLLTFMVIIGIGKILAVLYVKFADIDYLYSLVMSMLPFVSAMFIPLEHFPENVQFILTYNPVFLSLYLARNCIVYGVPSFYTAWLKLIIWAVGTYTFGTLVFNKNKNYLASEL